MIRLTKIDAAGLQLDAAIEHFLADEWVPAIHCAGAAEELCSKELERVGEKAGPGQMFEKADFGDLVPDKKGFVRTINTYRDWVKHTNPGQPAEIEIGEMHAHFSMLRATLAYGRLLARGLAPARASLDAFGDWFEANEERLDAEVEALPDFLEPPQK